MENKIFILFIEKVIDCETLQQKCYAYFNKDKAIERFKQIIKDVETSYPEDWEIEESETCFEMYEDGYYVHNHVIVKIEHCDIV